MPPKLTVEITPYNPPRSAVDEVHAHVARVARRVLGDGGRVLSVRLLPVRRAARASRFHATAVDYSSGRTLDLTGEIADPRRMEVTETARQPAVTAAEFEQAVNVVRDDPELGAALRAGRLRPYRPMPPQLPAELPDGARERRITVGLVPARRGDGRHEIVAVSLAHGRVGRFEDRAPRTALATDETCGVPAAANQPAADQGTAGTARIRVLRAGAVLWELLATRPAASSGSAGSGVELRNVRHRGRSVLHQAHVPILNVRYDGDKCGPFRDWLWQESMIRAAGADRAPGFRLCSSPARTILDTGSDRGDHLGVAVYVAGEDVVLVSELEAGWYRYVSEWRLRANGAIRPRFGFGATTSSCVCNVHHHHVYWRLDFDIGGPKNVVSEFNNPPLAGRAKWTQLAWESKRARDPARRRRWRVGDGAGHAYEIMPGAHDGTAAGDAYAQGDVWVVRRRPNQIDDHPAAGTEAEIDRFVSHESIVHEDVVVWYGAHFTHDVRRHGPADPDHVVGPTLLPRGW